MVIHIVCHKYKDPAEADKIVPMLKALEGSVEGLISLDAGRDFMHSGRSYDLGLVARLQDRAALERYAVDPGHVKVRAYINTVLQSGISVDFEI